MDEIFEKLNAIEAEQEKAFKDMLIELEQHCERVRQSIYSGGVQ